MLYSIGDLSILNLLRVVYLFGRPQYFGRQQYLALDKFVCVEVLQPSQTIGVMSSMVSLPNYTFTWQA